MLRYIIKTQNRHIDKMSGYTTKRDIFYMLFMAFVFTLFPVTFPLPRLNSKLKDLWEYCFQVNAHDTRS